MSLDLGELVAYVTLDDQQFQHGLDRDQQKFGGLASAVKTGGQVIATSLTAAAGLVATMGTNLVKTGANYNILQQNSRAALTTILGSQKAVNEQMAKLDELTSRSPFGKDVFIQGQQQLLAFGMAAEKVVPTLDAVQNAVAATGGSSQQLSEVTFVLAQIQAAGKITGQDLMQLGQRGIDAASLIGSSLGMSGEDVRASITKGTIGADQAIDALVKGMTAKFGGATDLIKQQWTGAVDRIHAAWRDTGAIIAKPFIDPNGGGQAVTWANLVADVMRQVQKHVATAMDAIDRKAGPTFDKVTSSLQKASAVVAGFDMNGLIRQVDSLSKYTPLITGAGSALVTLGLKPIPYVGKLAEGMGPLVAGIAALVASSPQLRGVADNFVSGLGPATRELGDASVKAADLAMQVINALTPGLSTAADGAADFLNDLSPLVPMFVDVAGELVPLVGAVGDLVGWVAQLPTPLLAAAAAIIAFHKPLGGIKDGIMGVADVGGKAVGWVRDFVAATSAVSAETGASKALVGIQSAAGGVGGALKGLISPAGLVGAGLVVLTGVVAAYAAKQAEAKKRVDDFTQALEASNGVIDESVRKLAYQQLDDAGLIDTFNKIGISGRDLVDYMAGVPEAVDRVTAAVEKNATVRAANSAYGQVEEGQLVRQSNAYDKAKSKLDGLTGGLEDAKDAQNAQTDAVSDGADAAEDAAKKIQRQKEALDALTDAQRSQAAANGDLVAAQYATKDAMADLGKAIQDMADTQTAVAYDTAGNVDLMADSNRGLVEATMSSVKSINDQMDAYAKAGHTQDEVTAKQDELTNSLYQQLVATGMSDAAARQLADAVGLIPDHKATKIDVLTEGAEADLDQLLADINTGDGTVTILANDNPAFETLAKSLGLVETSEGTYAINANDDPALTKLLMSLGVVDTSTGTITIDGNNQKAKDRTAEAQRFANGATGTMSINGHDYATDIARAAQARINNMTATIWIGATGKSVGMSIQADGSVLESYGSGGFHENHVAQIAPAGAYRLWAERETGGEGYIPLALSKRRRSEEIMSVIADQFGGMYIPANSLNRYADGDTNATPYQGPQNAPVIMFPDRILATFVIDDTTALDGYIDGRALAAQAQTSADVSLYRGGRR